MTMKYSYTIKDGVDIYANGTTISVELDEDATLDEAVAAFKMFLKGCEYSHEKVESLDFWQDGNIWNK